MNGEVPNLFVVHAGGGAEWNGDPSLFWSHSWSLERSTGLRADDLEFDGVTVNNYAMMPEVGGDLTGYAGTAFGPYPPTVGVYAHEYGHVLGLPDQYDYGYESQGTGIYSLMAGGSWNQWPTDPIFAGNSPSFLDAWSRYRLRFVTPIDVTTTTAMTCLLRKPLRPSTGWSFRSSAARSTSCSRTASRSDSTRAWTSTATARTDPR